MYHRWYYIHEGQTRGPVSPPEVRRLLAAGQLPPQELFWPEVADPQVIVEAQTAIELATASAAPGDAGPSRPANPPAPVPSPPVPSAVPDRLAHTQPFGAPRAQPQPTPKPAVPDWLDDVRRAENPNDKP